MKASTTVIHLEGVKVFLVQSSCLVKITRVFTIAVVASARFAMAITVQGIDYLSGTDSLAQGFSPLMFLYASLPAFVCIHPSPFLVLSIGRFKEQLVVARAVVAMLAIVSISELVWYHPSNATGSCLFLSL